MFNPRSVPSTLFELTAQTLKGLHAIGRALTGKPKAARARELSAAEFQNLLRQASFVEKGEDSAAEMDHLTWSQLLAYLIVFLGNSKSWKRVFPHLGRGPD